LVLVISAHIRGLETRAKRINVEEGVLPVLDVGYWRAVKRLVALISNCGQIHVRLLIGNLNALEFCIMEVGGVVRVLALSWLHLSVEAAELLFSEFKRVGRSEAVYLGWNNSFHVLAIDC